MRRRVETKASPQLGTNILVDISSFFALGSLEKGWLFGKAGESFMPRQARHSLVAWVPRADAMDTVAELVVGMTVVLMALMASASLEGHMAKVVGVAVVEVKFL